MKKEVMRNAWNLFKKKFSESFSECLKASWKLSKRMVELNNITDIEKATEIVNSKEALRWRFRDAELAVKNSDRRLDYVGNAVFTVENTKIWGKNKIARIYFTKKLDNVIVDNDYYTEVRI